VVSSTILNRLNAALDRAQLMLIHAIFYLVRIPVKWAPDSGDAGRRRSEATLVESYSIQVAHMSQEKGK
jgi:hypothetical protein